MIFIYMKYSSFLFTALSFCLAITSCDENDDMFDKPFTPQEYNVKGKVEKGPFISGSDISMQPLDAQLKVQGSMFNTSITDHQGNFNFGNQDFSTPYVEFMANGYFFNEVKGALSNGTLTLRALVDLQDNTTINVNVLTHLKYARIKNLVTSGKSFRDANKQAQKELLDAFGLGVYNNKEVSTYSITSGTDESAALIAISSLLLMDRTEAELTEYLSKLSADFGANGCFSDENKTQINADKEELIDYLQSIKENVIERYDNLGMSVTVKNLLFYLDWNNDGIAGNELLKENETVSVDNSLIEVPSDGGEYTVIISSPVPVYLEPQGGDYPEEIPSTTVQPENYISKLYELNDEYYTDNEISLETRLVDSKLKITVSPLISIDDKSTNVYLYDYVGNVVATVQIVQKGDIMDAPVDEIPLLGEDGQMIVASIASTLADALSDFNLIEQYYAYNKGTNLVNANIKPYSNVIFSAWSKLYKANNMLLNLEDVDRNRLNVYGAYINVLSAMCYSNLVYGWGGVPYFENYDHLQQAIEFNDIRKESEEYVLNQIEEKLRGTMELLPEKKNESLKDINGFFFMSKDVAKVLLANICIYKGELHDARHLLEEVIRSDFYQLDASGNFNSNDSDIMIDTDIVIEDEMGPAGKSIKVNESTEVIFALINSNSTGTTRSGVTIAEPTVIPYITLSDVYLSYIECCYMLGDLARAEVYMNELFKIKNLNITEDNYLMKVKQAREQLLLNNGTYFAFLKRTGLAKDICEVEDYQLLFPIPNTDVTDNVPQNNGY